jgi:glycosyltransferase involved in cell wall biosynthesis
MDRAALRLSVIVPFYNEAENIARMHEAIVRAVEPLGVSFEMVFVDDGSKDNTLEIAEQLANSDARVRVLKFRRNFGQTPAMAAGIEYARGEVLITMDGDLQNDPADIEHFLSKMDEGYDIVVGWRFNRQDKLISRRIPSRIANRLIGQITGVPIMDNGCSLKAYRASVIKSIPLYSEMHRFIPAMASIAGPRIAEIKVRHHARQFGKSKYGLSRVYKVLLDLMVIKTVATFTARPLLWFGLLSLPMLSCRRIGIRLIR